MYRFCWHDLMSTAPEKSIAFFEELFPEWGLVSEEFEDPQTGKFTFHKITVGGAATVSVVPFHPPVAVPSHWMCSVAVEDCDESVDRLEELGGKRCYPIFEAAGAGRFTVVDDSTGGYLKVLQPAQEIPLPTEDADGIFSWHELITPDVGKVKSVYEGVFGWGSREMDMGDSGVYTLFTLDGQEIAGAMNTPPGAAMPPCWLPYVTANDLDDRAAKVERLGGTVHMPPTDVGGMVRIAIVAEPTGATFGLVKQLTAPPPKA